MKIAQLCWCCDLCTDEESPVATRWGDVRRLAFKDGWTTRRFAGEELHVCRRFVRHYATRHSLQHGPDGGPYICWGSRRQGEYEHVTRRVRSDHAGVCRSPRRPAG